MNLSITAREILDEKVVNPQEISLYSANKKSVGLTFLSSVPANMQNRKCLDENVGLQQGPDFLKLAGRGSEAQVSLDLEEEGKRCLENIVDMATSNAGFVQAFVDSFLSQWEEFRWFP